jgi:hypothetical protein
MSRPDVWTDEMWADLRNDVWAFDARLKAAGLCPLGFCNRKPIFAEDVEVDWMDVQRMALGDKRAPGLQEAEGTAKPRRKPRKPKGQVTMDEH